VNLLENAARYTPKDAAIRISAERHDGEVELVVADHGPGIPRGAEERVFERFQRASSVTGGTGLGLAICRGVIALHGGHIWAESPPGGGAAIHFTLPIEGEPPPISAAENDPDPPGTAQELSV
jgi:two-component system sensor histidine kinase KdpD